MTFQSFRAAAASRTISATSAASTRSSEIRTVALNSGSGSRGGGPMKVLEFYGVKPEDSLLLTFDGAFNPQLALEVELAPFLQALEEYADGWMPDVVKGKRQRKYARAAVWKSLEERRGENSTGLGLYRTEWPALDMSNGARMGLPLSRHACRS
ncbi:MAG TPA: hypothetical protein VEU33_14085 [Archangium sp.]|nr:hypothetical protein [Archangium sp.]